MGIKSSSIVSGMLYMRKIFQKEWHGILFGDFTKMSSRRLADADFYKSFYRHLLTKYHDWSDLDPEWVRVKLQTAGLLESKLYGQKNVKICLCNADRLHQKVSATLCRVKPRKDVK